MQELAIAAVYRARRSLREGRRFAAICRELDESQWLSATELRNLQRDRMRDIVPYAATPVPYYQSAFARHNFRPRPAMEIGDLLDAPFLTKKDVVKAGASLLAEKSRSFRIRGATSGTTGLSLVGYRNLEAINYENAFISRQLRWAGYKSGEPRAWIRGEVIVPTTDHKGPFWRRNRADNMLVMSSFHLSETSVPRYLTALEGFDPVLIQAYPSSISYIA